MTDRRKLEKLPSHVILRPTGWTVRFRCRLFGHQWYGCYDERCCDGLLCWCDRCGTNDAHLRTCNDGNPRDSGALQESGGAGVRVRGGASNNKENTQ